MEEMLLLLVSGWICCSWVADKKGIKLRLKQLRNGCNGLSTMSKDEMNWAYGLLNCSMSCCCAQVLSEESVWLLLQLQVLTESGAAVWRDVWNGLQVLKSGDWSSSPMSYRVCYGANGGNDLKGLRQGWQDVGAIDVGFKKNAVLVILKCLDEC